MRTTTPTKRSDRRPGAALALCLALLIAPPAPAAVTDAFTADFEVHRGSIALGTTTFSLEPGERAGCYVYSGRADPNALVRMFIGRVTDESRFCIEDGTIRPQHFRHHIDGDAEDSYTLDFDWSAHEVTYENDAGQRKTMALGERALDPLSIQIAARRWLARADDPAALGEARFAMIDEDERKTYTLRVSDGGTIETEAGIYDTLRVERVDSSRHLRFWLAKNADWIPVRVEHQKGDGGVFRMSATRLQR